jgi:hypothetical protein
VVELVMVVLIGETVGARDERIERGKEGGREKKRERG